MIIDRGQRRDISREEEEQVRDSITHITRSRSATLLHIPNGDSTDPLCQYRGEGCRRWYRIPVDAIPIGHRALCSHCVDRWQHG